jgi:tRNA threonylcarbamoyl adenosine modification protein YeaZ
VRTLVIDTATAACSIALIEDGVVIAHAHQVVGRGHAERLVPMIAALPEGGRAGRILVDVGPGSFTGLRVGIAAARGLALGWGAEVAGYSSLALIAARGFADRPTDELAVVIEGGHGEVFMQSFAPGPAPLADLASLRPEAAALAIAGRPAIGNGLHWLYAIDETQELRDALPDAADVLLLSPALCALPPRPIYGRAPDAKPPV